jgi:hypothetical protein
MIAAATYRNKSDTTISQHYPDFHRDEYYLNKSPTLRMNMSHINKVYQDISEKERNKKKSEQEVIEIYEAQKFFSKSSTNREKMN